MAKAATNLRRTDQPVQPVKALCSVLLVQPYGLHRPAEQYTRAIHPLCESAPRHLLLISRQCAARDLAGRSIDGGASGDTGQDTTPAQK